MGLDFSHCEAHWGYAGFNLFRTKLAAEVGIALHCMEGFCFDYTGRQPVISWDKINDNIALLLNHSDCDGILTPKECKKVYPRLLELIKDWPDEDCDKQKALELANGMRKAARLNQNLRFC